MPRENWPLIAALCACTALVTFVSTERLSPKKDRYEIVTVNAGTIAHLDRKTGQVSFVSTSGKILAEYPSADAAAYAAIASPVPTP